MIRRLAAAVLVLAGLVAAYLLLWPVGFEPGRLEVAKPPAATGVLVPNHALRGAEVFEHARALGPEAVAFDSAGRIYGGLEDGTILRWADAARPPEVFAETGGWPLGLAFDASGNLLVADCRRGLLGVAPDGTVAELVRQAAGRPVQFADDVAVAPDGTVYFSDGSIYPLEDPDPLRSFLDGKPYGRVIAYRPASGSVDVVLEGLHFANGVAVAPDGSFLLVDETWAYRVRRLWLTGPRAGESEVFADNLPGLPDNIRCAASGTCWVALWEPRDPARERLQGRPFLRTVLARLPRSWLAVPPAPRVGQVVGLDLDGTPVAYLADPDGAVVFSVTSATEHGGWLYLGTIADRALKRLPLPGR